MNKFLMCVAAGFVSLGLTGGEVFAKGGHTNGSRSGHSPKRSGKPARNTSRPTGHTHTRKPVRPITIKPSTNKPSTYEPSTYKPRTYKPNKPTRVQRDGHPKTNRNLSPAKRGRIAKVVKRHIGKIQNVQVRLALKNLILGLTLSRVQINIVIGYLNSDGCVLSPGESEEIAEAVETAGDEGDEGDEGDVAGTDEE